MTWDRKVPLQKDSRVLLSYALEEDDIIWVEADKPFYAKLEFLRFARGRSFVRAVFRVVSTSEAAPLAKGTEVGMFLKDFQEILSNMEWGIFPLRNSFTFGTQWQFVKRGQNYGIKASGY